MKEKLKLKPNRQITYAVIALLCSLILWAYIRSEVNPYSDPWVYRIPVTFEGAEILESDRSLTFLAGEDVTVDLHLYGKRKDTVNLNRNNISITVDLRTIRNAGTYSMDYEIQFPDSISNNAVQILEQSPSSVPVTVGNLLSKKIPVFGSGGSPAEGYLAETMLLNPAEITVCGPEDVVKNIKQAEIFLDRENLQSTVVATLDYTLVDLNGNVVENDKLSCDVEQIEVELPIVATKTVPLTVELIAGAGATSEDTLQIIEPDSIQIAGDPELLKDINQISLGTISLGDIITEEDYTRPIILPNETQNLSGEEEATIHIELCGLDTRTLRVTNIELENKSNPDQYEYRVVSSFLSVSIRGKLEQVQKVYASMLRAVVDLSEYQEPGQYKVPVNVYIDEYSDIGVLHEDEYAVVISITEKKPEASSAASTEEKPGE